MLDSRRRETVIGKKKQTQKTTRERRDTEHRWGLTAIAFIGAIIAIDDSIAPIN
jgi:hypothetical protein